jgi:hypothetical protein
MPSSAGGGDAGVHPFSEYFYEREGKMYCIAPNRCGAVCSTVSIKSCPDVVDLVVEIVGGVSASIAARSSSTL